MLNEKTPVKVPNKAEKIATLIMGPPNWKDTCHSRAWSRQYEAPVDQMTVPCEKLKELYAWNTVENLQIVKYGDAPSNGILQKYHKPILTPGRRKAFATALTPKMRNDLLFFLKSISEVATFGLWLGGESLLGLALNRSLLAWSDAVDLYMSADDRSLVELIEPLLLKKGLLIVPFWGGYKLFRKGDPIVGGTAWAYPSVEIIVYDENRDSDMCVFRENKKIKKIDNISSWYS